MKQKYSLIHIEQCQVKSLEKAKLLCSLLDSLEKEFGIKEVEISFKDMFICPDIDLTILSNSNDPMEKIVGGLFIKLDRIKHGNKSNYK
jgi:hypothetical protein